MSTFKLVLQTIYQDIKGYIDVDPEMNGLIAMGKKGFNGFGRKLILATIYQRTVPTKCYSLRIAASCHSRVRGAALYEHEVPIFMMDS